jgi:hypothetical protein
LFGDNQYKDSLYPHALAAELAGIVTNQGNAQRTAQHLLTISEPDLFQRAGRRTFK